MDVDKIAELALTCCEGDAKRATALLELFKISLQLDGEMSLVGCKKCLWEHSGQCFKDIPDSIRACKKPCEFMEIDV